LFKFSSSTFEPDLHTSSIIPRHAPPNRVHRRRPLQLPEAQATSVIARELVALRRACGLRSAFPGRARCWMGSTMVDPLLGGTGDSACPPRAAVSGGLRPCSLPAAALGFLCFNFFVHSFVSTVDHSLSFCNAQMFMDLFGVWSRLGQFIWCPCNSCGLYLENCFKSDLFLT
jgi:hypothetical protein